MSLLQAAQRGCEAGYDIVITSVVRCPGSRSRLCRQGLLHAHRRTFHWTLLRKPRLKMIKSPTLVPAAFRGATVEQSGKSLRLGESPRSSAQMFVCFLVLFGWFFFSFFKIFFE